MMCIDELDLMCLRAFQARGGARNYLNSLVLIRVCVCVCVCVCVHVSVSQCLSFVTRPPCTFGTKLLGLY